jgi:beta-glucosidase
MNCVYYNDGSDVAAALALAKTADAVLVFIATTSSEGGDRSDLSFGAEDDLATQVAQAAAGKTAVVAVTPGAVLTPWAKDAAAVLIPFMPGQAYGDAVMDVIFGDVNPSGRLPLTFPNVENEVNFTQSQWPGVNGRATYTEKLLVGYRYYDEHQITPAFPFGHGLSYTTFSYANLKIASGSSPSVSVEVTNTGKVSGSDIPQLYLGFPTGSDEPPQQLKGFKKVTLAPGAKQTVTFTLTDRDLSVWDTGSHAFKKVTGTFDVAVGASSRSISQKGTLVV